MGDIVHEPFYYMKDNPVFRYNCDVAYKKLTSIIALLIICTGCDATLATQTVSLPEFVTATLPPTAIPVVTQTPLPPTIAPTIAPIAGTTTTEVNVRADTSTASETLGTISAFSTIQITGKDASGNWIQILFNDGTGWVRADYVQVNDASAEIPVVGAETGNGVGTRGVVLRGVYVRSGPGQDFDSFGLLNQNDVVAILGKDSSGAWMNIQYPAAPDGTGWVAAEFLQIENNVDAIPLVEEEVQVKETDLPETPQAILPSKIAWLDNDTADAPLATFNLSAATSRSVQFQGEVSAPNGDGEDWLSFSSQSDGVVIQVLCESGAIQVELMQLDVRNLLDVNCGSAQQIQVTPNQEYQLRITPVLSNEQVFIKYEIRIKTED